MGRHIKQTPKRCPECGAMVVQWPKESDVCYGCLTTRAIRREQQKAKEYGNDRDASKIGNSRQDDWQRRGLGKA